MSQFILMDIEGTTTPIDFVHKVLFPYSKKKIADYIEAHLEDPDLQEALQQVKNDVKEETGRSLQPQEIAAILQEWINEDRKHPALKEIQGRIWKSGYQNGDYQSELYPDVYPAWQKWKRDGIQLGIYSSGSVAAQKLLFGYTPHGDLNSYLQCYFDLTNAGPKREEASYNKILAELGIVPSEVLFLSDVPAELDAAKRAGIQAHHIVREGTPKVMDYPSIPSFDQVPV